MSVSIGFDFHNSLPQLAEFEAQEVAFSIEMRHDSVWLACGVPSVNNLGTPPQSQALRRRRCDCWARETSHLRDFFVPMSDSVAIVRACSKTRGPERIVSPISGSFAVQASFDAASSKTHRQQRSLLPGPNIRSRLL